ncbi:ROK family protein [Bacillus sp. FJAT-18019]|nr:ROK family protein [Bacillus sp. FJAT-18019]
MAKDNAHIKKMNQALIISSIMEHGEISRAELAKVTGLNKSTITVQTGELLEQTLLLEETQEHYLLGRRPISLSINPEAGYALGIDLDRNHAAFMITDLLGKPIHTETVGLASMDYHDIVRLLTQYIRHYQEEYDQASHGLIGVAIGIHGLVDHQDQVTFAQPPIDKGRHLQQDLQSQTSLRIHLKNNANLCAFAESVYGHPRSNHLLSIHLGSGIGLGLRVNTETLTGYHGFAGEIGHMIIQPEGRPCSCGNKGCWEQYASEGSFMEQLSSAKHKSDISYEDIKRWMQESDPVTCHLMEQYYDDIAIGLNNVINLCNPEITILNSELLRLHSNAAQDLRTRLRSTISNPHVLLISGLGNQACVMGACAYVIQQFWGTPRLDFTAVRK